MATPARGGGGKPWYLFQSFNNFFRTLGVFTAVFLVVGFGFCIGASYSGYIQTGGRSRQVRPDSREEARETRREEKAARPVISPVSSVPSPAVAQQRVEDEAARRLRIFRESLAKSGEGNEVSMPERPRLTVVQSPIGETAVNETAEQKAARLEKEAARRSAERKAKGGSQ